MLRGHAESKNQWPDNSFMRLSHVSNPSFDVHSGQRLSPCMCLSPPLPPAAPRVNHVHTLGGVTHTVSGCLAWHSSHLCTCSPQQRSRESYIGIREPIPRHHVGVAICTCPSRYAAAGAWGISRMETASVLRTCPLASDHQRITGAKPCQFCKSAVVLMQKLAWRCTARPRSSATQNSLNRGQHTSHRRWL